MPRGIYNRALADKGGGSQTERLLEAMRDIEERLAVARAKDKALSGLREFAERHELTATDLRAVAKQLGARKKGSAPVLSLNTTKAQAIARGRRLREAREAKRMSNQQLSKQVGTSSSVISQWEGGALPKKPEHRTKLTKALDLPKGFFDLPKANGHAAAG